MDQDLYAEIEEIGTYPPGPDASSGIQTSDTFVGGSQDKVLMPYKPWDVHELAVVWKSRGGVLEFWVDGERKQAIVNNSISGPLKVALVVTSVLPVTPNDGSNAEVIYGPLTVRGVPV
jgi:hypothetical protein